MQIRDQGHDAEWVEETSEWDGSCARKARKARKAQSEASCMHLGPVSAFILM